MHAFNIRELREKTGALVRSAEAGELSMVTKHGRPVFLTIPVDDRLITLGANSAIATHLYESGVVSAAKAAKIAGLPLFSFLKALSKLEIPVVDQTPEEIMEDYRRARDSMK